MRVRDTDYMPEIEAANSLRPSLTATLMLLVVSAFLVWAVVWAAFAEVAEVTRGAGRIIPASEVQVVQSLEGGILTELLVDEGDKVAQGQLLLRLDDVAQAAEARSTTAQIKALEAQRARLVAEISGGELRFPADVARDYPEFVANERALFDSRRADLARAITIVEDQIRQTRAREEETRARLRALDSNIPLFREELEIEERLVARNAGRAIDVNRIRQRLNEAVGERSSAASILERLAAERAEQEQRIEELRSQFATEAQGELNEIDVRVAALEEGLNPLADRVRRTELRSPVNGIVQRIAVKTPGGVVQAAMRLVEIVPIEDDLVVRARIQPQDVAFLHPGQDVRVKITAYDHLIFGSLDGALERISADTVVDENGNSFFEVDVRTRGSLVDNDGQPLPIIPGMIAEVDVITGNRTILDYMLKPILRVRSRALTER